MAPMVSTHSGWPMVRTRTPARSAGLAIGFLVSMWRAPWYQLNDSRVRPLLFFSCWFQPAKVSDSTNFASSSTELKA